MPTFAMVCCRIDLFIHHAVSNEIPHPRRSVFQKADAAKQCGFAGTGRTDDRCHIARMYNKSMSLRTALAPKDLDRCFTSRIASLFICLFLRSHQFRYFSLCQSFLLPDNCNFRSYVPADRSLPDQNLPVRPVWTPRSAEVLKRQRS